MKITWIGCLFLSALTLVVRAETRTVDAYFGDQKCLSYYRETQPEKLRDHTRACVLACGRTSGYGVLTSDADEYFPLDSEGNKLALTWLETSSRERNLLVKVTLSYEGGKPRVVKIE